ncbi:MAG: hypothetical protein LBQ46_10630 [Treponema sp.]|jgi:hypothetical protein|nr:hypothetical protein [Treponema sp.]
MPENCMLHFIIDAVGELDIRNLRSCARMTNPAAEQRGIVVLQGMDFMSLR